MGKGEGERKKNGFCSLQAVLSPVSDGSEITGYWNDEAEGPSEGARSMWTFENWSRNPLIRMKT